MKFALFEFCEDNSCAIGESEWIAGEDASILGNEDWEDDKEILVKWPLEREYLKWSNTNGKFEVDQTKARTYAARVLKFNGKFKVLVCVKE